ncbi:MAG: sulfatase-like hydrolase/transferase [Alphaproteobacteria bacterium]|nr:sulfatase-like hydrolase/transferase [Alphaproteobacteria bacterium]
MSRLLLDRRQLVVGAAALAASCAGPRPPGGPNVLVVLVDQLRACSLPAYGERDLETPGFDRVFAEGTRCDRAFTPNPLCGPARAALLTGWLPEHVGVPSNDHALSLDARTFGDAFRAVGYRCGWIGKWHLAPPGQQHPHGLFGFEDWFASYNTGHRYRHSRYFLGTDPTVHRPEPADRFEPAWQVDQALDKLAEWQDAPWMLVVSFAPPHPPDGAWPEWADELPDGFPFGLDPAALTLRANVTVEDLLDGPAQGVRNYLLHYDGAILALEAEIRRLFDGLDALGLADDTLVVLTSDHGDLAGSHGLYLKQKPYDEAVRVPLGFRWPGRIPVGAWGTPFSHVDLLPTVAGLAGVPLAAPVQGRDLSTALLEGTELEAPVLMGSHVGRPELEWWSLRDRRHQYVRYTSGEELLFDMDADPYQLDDLSGRPEHAALEASLAERLAEERARFAVD